MKRKALLSCGILSSLVYVAANVAGARRWREYSSVSQTVSELSAIGAPSRPVMVPLLPVGRCPGARQHRRLPAVAGGPGRRARAAGL